MLGYFQHIQMIEYCRLNIEYLWNAVDLKRTEQSNSFNLQFAIFNFQFRLNQNLPDENIK